MNPNDRYITLKNLVVQRGLLHKQPGYYTLYALGLAGLWVAGIMLLWSAPAFSYQLGATVFFAFVFAQAALFFHDAGHGQITTGERADRIIDAVFSIIMGLSMTWWRDKHNRHHAHPNHEELDPDIRISLFSFSRRQTAGKRGLKKFTSAYQHLFLFPMLFFELWHLRIAGYHYLLTKKPKGWMQELALVGTHLAVYTGLWFLFFPPFSALLLIVLHHGLVGIYLGSVFATNHKGMPTVDEASDFFTTQVLTTRNVRGGKLTAFLYGGLNFQIEHHLFPGAPRNNLRKIREIVKSFCAEEGVLYYETSPFQSYREIYRELKKISAPLRAHGTENIS